MSGKTTGRPNLFLHLSFDGNRKALDGAPPSIKAPNLPGETVDVKIPIGPEHCCSILEELLFRTSSLSQGVRDLFFKSVT